MIPTCTICGAEGRAEAVTCWQCGATLEGSGAAGRPDSEQIILERLGRPGPPGRWSWLAVGLLAALWLAPWRPDDIVEGLLHRRLVAEAAAPAWASFIAGSETIGRAAAVLVAWRLWAWILILLVRAAGPAARALGRPAGVALSLLCRLGQEALVRVRRATAPFCAAAGKSLRLAGRGLALLGLGVSTALGAVGTMTALALGALGAALAAPLGLGAGLLWLGARRLGRGLGVGLVVAGRLLKQVLLLAWAAMAPVLVWLGRAGKAITISLWRALAGLVRLVGLLLRLAWLETATDLRALGRTLGAVGAALFRATGSGLATLFHRGAGLLLFTVVPLGRALGLAGALGWLVVAGALRALGRALGELRRAAAVVLAAGARPLHRAIAKAGALPLALGAAIRYGGRVGVAVVRPLGRAISMGLLAIGLLLGRGLGTLGTVAWLALGALVHAVGLGLRVAGGAAAGATRPLVAGLACAVTTLGSAMGAAGGFVGRALLLAALAALRAARAVLRPPARALDGALASLGRATAAALAAALVWLAAWAGWGLGATWKGLLALCFWLGWSLAWAATLLLVRAPHASRRSAAAARGWAALRGPRLARAAGRALARHPRLAAAVGVAALASVTAVYAEAQNVVVVTHWANGHMMSETLLPAFARDFNAAGHRTAEGRRIEVRPVLVNSGLMVEELIARVSRGEPSGRSNQAVGGNAAGRDLPDPVIVTPAADHWLGDVNHALGGTAVDVAGSRPIATTWIGIVTSREMARCLGWGERSVGFAEVLALRADPRGWASCPSARAEWGRRPLISFTDPNSSSTGRSILFTLYSIAAGKAPEELTGEDVARPEVVEYVRRFQRSVDHYVADSLLLNSKVYLGPRYGHLFFLGEDNLVKLYQGKVAVTVADETRPRALERDMVMIYPWEGSTRHNHSAALVQAPWVTPQQAEAAERWIAYLREEPQQQAFLAEGFRPAMPIPLGETISARYRLDPDQPQAVSNTDRINPGAARAIVEAWVEVKKPGAVAFVIDTSGSMFGTKLKQAQKGVTRALGAMHPANQVGLVTFSTGINQVVAVGPLSERQQEMAAALKQMKAAGDTALYDAIQRGIEMVDAAPADSEATRGVVVVTDGRATGGLKGAVSLDRLIQMQSTAERAIARCSGFEGDNVCFDDQGQRVGRGQVIGTGLAIATRHRVHVFFVGIGPDVDLEVGRMLAEATGAAYAPATDAALDKVLEQFGKYF